MIHDYVKAITTTYNDVTNPKYPYGQTIDSSKVKVLGTYASGKIGDLTAKSTITNVPTSLTKTTTYNASYIDEFSGNLTATNTLNMYLPNVNYSINGEATKVLTQGETITTMFDVKVFATNGYTVKVNGVEVPSTGKTLSGEGTYTIELSFNGTTLVNGTVVIEKEREVRWTYLRSADNSIYGIEFVAEDVELLKTIQINEVRGEKRKYTITPDQLVNNRFIFTGSNGTFNMTFVTIGGNNGGSGSNFKVVPIQ